MYRVYQMLSRTSCGPLAQCRPLGSLRTLGCGKLIYTTCPDYFRQYFRMCDLDCRNLLLEHIQPPPTQLKFLFMNT